MWLDRVGTVDDMSEGFFRMLSPPSSGTTGVAHDHGLVRQVRLDHRKLISLANQNLRGGKSMPRIVENNDMFISDYMHIEKKHV
jgi:hypothetical protein